MSPRAPARIDQRSVAPALVVCARLQLTTAGEHDQSPSHGWEPVRVTNPVAFVTSMSAVRRTAVVGEGGLEPPRPEGHWHLKPARLPFRHSPGKTTDGPYHCNGPSPQPARGRRACSVPGRPRAGPGLTCADAILRILTVTQRRGVPIPCLGDTTRGRVVCLAPGDMPTTSAGERAGMGSQKGLVQRIERKLESTVGDAFARVFGGSIVPQEVEALLRREADDGVRALERKSPFGTQRIRHYPRCARLREGGRRSGSHVGGFRQIPGRLYP